MAESSRRLIAGIGSALVDLLIFESDEFVARTGAQKGGMTLVDDAYITNLLSQTKNKPAIVPGGSACNTILGAGNLGGPARFMGKRGDDEMGLFFENSLKASHVEPRLSVSSSPTGRVLSVITPDAQRTMFTCLGASSESTADEVDVQDFADAAVIHIEGYLLFNESLMRRAVELAKQTNARVSLDLASFTVVNAKRDILMELASKVDILIANEDEASAFTGMKTEHEAMAALAALCPIAVHKLGKRGSIISRIGETITVGIKGDGSALDTTGAGDLWAAGFLYGIINGFSLERCGELASACGYEVCQVQGASIPADGWKRIKALLAN